MNIVKVPISVTDLKVGMFVSSLDRAWLETPFLLQGFSIKDVEDINLLGQHCTYVYVDKRTIPQDFKPTVIIDPKVSTTIIENALRKKPNTSTEKSFKEEIKRAKLVHDEIEDLIRVLFQSKESASKLNLLEVKKAITPMVNSIFKNPDAMIYLSHLRDHDNYGYSHSIATSVWATALGRQIGLPRDQLTDLAIGALMCDIGKLDLPQSLLTKSGPLEEGEFDTLKRHVDFSINRITKSIGINHRILATVAHHHERESGKGYPLGLTSNDIPLFAKIAGIADSYDAMISNRVYCQAISPNEAIHKLYEWRNIDFQAELVEEFIKTLGIYPVGSLVELSDDSVAIVIKVGQSQRLKPKVMLILDGAKKPLHPMRIIDLKLEQDRGITKAIRIKRGLPSDAYGIDPRELYL